jgi:Kef-type K+ transport system membrane component KefB/nucleotide-binding universal stress UspA family protein
MALREQRTEWRRFWQRGRCVASLSEGQILLLLVDLAVILVVGRGGAEIARRVGQPEVLGELLGGFLLGPSVFGAVAPGAQGALFANEAVGTALSAFSWLGAILLLLIAGLEVDLDILRREAKPGAFAAAFAIVPSLVAGAIFARLALGTQPPAGLFLGIVLSVTAVSVAAKILLERDVLRRDYAQVILAAGIASEVLVWLLIAIVSSFQGGSPLRAGLQSALFAVAFLAVMMTAGRRFTFWAMRRMADMTQIVSGQLSLVLVLACGAAAVTAALGLHPLLGAFVFGVLLSESPRATVPLRQRVQALTTGVFAPIFFVLAGMRVDIFQLGSLRAGATVLALFAVASVIKVGFGALGARLGGLGWWEGAIVGVGVNLKGGTDVIVAILGAELGLLSVQGYAMYALVAILTVLVSPPILGYLEQRVPPSDEEQARLTREEARRQAYLPTVERVMVPVVPELFPAAAASIVETIARAKAAEDEFFDIVQLNVEQPAVPSAAEQPALVQARGGLGEAGERGQVEVSNRQVDPDDALDAILAASRDHVLLAVGARMPKPAAVLSLGALQDRIIDQAAGDILVAVLGEATSLPPIDRILVSVSGLEYSLKAADVAGYLAKALEAELVLFTTVPSKLDTRAWDAHDRREVLEAGYRSVREAVFRLGRLDVRISARVELGNDTDALLTRELELGGYQLLVMGAIDRGGDSRLNLGATVQSVLAKARTPTVLLVSHEPAGNAGAAGE